MAQAVGSVTDMFSCVVSIAILPKPSAAAGEETHQYDSIFNKAFNENEISPFFCFLIIVHLSEVSDNTAWQIIKILETFNRHRMKHEWFKLIIWNTFSPGGESSGGTSLTATNLCSFWAKT